MSEMDDQNNKIYANLFHVIQWEHDINLTLEPEESYYFTFALKKIFFSLPKHIHTKIIKVNPH